MILLPFRASSFLTLAATAPRMEYGLRAAECPWHCSSSKSRKGVWGVRGSVNRDCKTLQSRGCTAAAPPS